MPSERSLAPEWTSHLPTRRALLGPYIADSNTRRNVSKGQRAMAKALRFPDPAKRGRGNKSPETGAFPHQRLSEARAVLHHSRTLAESVAKGITPLDAALATVRQESVCRYRQAETSAI